MTRSRARRAERNQRRAIARELARVERLRAVALAMRDREGPVSQIRGRMQTAQYVLGDYARGIVDDAPQLDLVADDAAEAVRSVREWQRFSIDASDCYGDVYAQRALEFVWLDEAYRKFLAFFEDYMAIPPEARGEFDYVFEKQKAIVRTSPCTISRDDGAAWVWADDSVTTYCRVRALRGAPVENPRREALNWRRLSEQKGGA